MIRDPRGNDVQYIRNQLNQIVREYSQSATLPGLTGGIRTQTDRFYDANGNLIRVGQQRQCCTPLSNGHKETR